MSLTVYGAPVSPFVRKVLWYVAEQGLAHTHQIIMPVGPQPDWYRDISPLGKIPAITDGDYALADSSIICAYLNDAYPQPYSLYPQSAPALAQVRWLEKYADEELAKVITFGLFANRVLLPSMGMPADEKRVAAALAKLPKLFDYLEQALGGAEYFVGNAFGLADVAIMSQWQNLRYAGEDIDAQRWPGLAAHADRMSERPAWQQLAHKEHSLLAQLGQQ